MGQATFGGRKGYITKFLNCSYSRSRIFFIDFRDFLCRHKGYVQPCLCSSKSVESFCLRNYPLFVCSKKSNLGWQGIWATVKELLPIVLVEVSLPMEFCHHLLAFGSIFELKVGGYLNSQVWHTLGQPKFAKFMPHPDL